MKLLLTFVTLVLLAIVKADKDAQDSSLSMVLVKGLQTQLKTCMDQNRDLVQRSCQKPGHWGGNRGRGIYNTRINHAISNENLHGPEPRPGTEVLSETWTLGREWR